MKTLDACAVGFIGAGNMAEAIVRGLIARGVAPAARILASDASPERLSWLAGQFGIAVTADNLAVVRDADVIVLAVKPQVMPAVLEPLGAAFRPDQLVISIAAGIRTQKLDSWCGGVPAIVRVMPNTPALIGQGVSAMCAGPRADASHTAVVDALFAAVGIVLTVKEDDMDAVTAISGSGPAYVFYWMEAMLKAARDLGFDAETARHLVYQTLSGSAALAAASAESPEVLRARVTSKGGTTEAAIRTLDEQQAGAALVAAVKAAAARSRELSHM